MAMGASLMCSKKNSQPKHSQQLGSVIVCHQILTLEQSQFFGQGAKPISRRGHGKKMDLVQPHYPHKRERERGQSTMANTFIQVRKEKKEGWVESKRAITVSRRTNQHNAENTSLAPGILL